MNKKYIQLIIVSISITLIFLTMNFQKKNADTQTVMSFSKAVTETVQSENALYKEIKEKASKYEVKPIDAYIDKIWKKTPGKSGKRVNVDESYEKMKTKKIFNEKLLTYKILLPKVMLKDLQASPLYRGHPDKQAVSLHINVSWGTEYIPNILKTLKKQEVKATFFIEGKWAKENTEMVEMIFEEGHVIGNHAYNHPDMADISKKEITEQITKTNDIIEAIIKKRPIWFAPPSGSFTNEVVQIAHEEKMETILWTVDTVDWKRPTVSVMNKRVLGKVHPGATILMHPTAVVEAGLEEMILGIKNKNLEIETISDLLKES